MLLLCSDGLTDMVSSQEITSVLTGTGSLTEKGKKLIDAANQNGGRDNITVVLVQNDKTVSRPQAVMPVPEQKKKWQAIPKIGASKTNIIRDESLATPVGKPKGGSGLTIFLVLLCVLLLAGNAYQYYQNNQPPAVVPLTDTTATKQPRKGAAESKLQDTLNQYTKKDTLFLKDSVFKSPVTISDAIHIDKDTLFVSGNGNLILKRDSAYSGPAFILGAKCKFVVLSNLTIEGFDKGIVFNNNSAYLKHVKFVNCKIPVQASLAVTDGKFVSGRMNAQVFKIDSAVVKPAAIKPVTTKKPKKK